MTNSKFAIFSLREISGRASGSLGVLDELAQALHVRDAVLKPEAHRGGFRISTLGVSAYAGPPYQYQTLPDPTRQTQEAAASDFVGGLRRLVGQPVRASGTQPSIHLRVGEKQITLIP